MRFLILAHSGDATATHVAARLLQRHPPGDTRVVWMEDIALAPRWAHTLNGTKPHTILTLRDGTEIRSDQIGIVFNRLRYVDLPQFQASETADRDYARMEMFAFVLSWLNALPCPVVSRVSSQNLAGPLHSSLAWQQFAGKAGLPTARMRVTSSLRRYRIPDLVVYPVGPTAIGNVPAWLSEPLGEQHAFAFVAGEQVLGNIPAELKPGCLKLAALSGCEVLLIHFARNGTNGSWKFNGTDPYPAVTDPSAIDALVNLLEARS